MAEKRMFSKTIVDSDAFLDMPLSAQALYFHLSMRADDDGFLNNAKKIMRTINANQNDYDLLIAKAFIIQFDDGICVIKHWRINNYLRSDRYKPTIYQEQKNMLEIKDNGRYSLINQDGIPDGYQCETQNSIDKNSIDKNSNSIKDTICPTGTVERIVKKWNTLSDLGIKPVMKIGERTQRKEWLSARLKTYSEEDFITAINNIRESKFLQGHNKNGWVITFDWFIRPNNFPKVLEGNYNMGTSSKEGEIDARQNAEYGSHWTDHFFDSK